MTESFQKVIDRILSSPVKARRSVQICKFRHEMTVIVASRTENQQRPNPGSSKRLGAHDAPPRQLHSQPVDRRQIPSNLYRHSSLVGRQPKQSDQIQVLSWLMDPSAPNREPGLLHDAHQARRVVIMEV